MPLEQAAQLGDRLVVLVDAQVDQRIVLGAVDDQVGRVLAAMLAAPSAFAQSTEAKPAAKPEVKAEPAKK